MYLYDLRMLNLCDESVVLFFCFSHLTNKLVPESKSELELSRKWHHWTPNARDDNNMVGTACIH